MSTDGVDHPVSFGFRPWPELSNSFMFPAEQQEGHSFDQVKCVITDTGLGDRSVSLTHQGFLEGQGRGAPHHLCNAEKR